MFSNDELCRDPLFQLNLILWLSLPSISKKPLRPIFNEAGFSIYSIEPLLTLIPEQRLLVRDNNINCQDSVRPDIVLYRKETTQTFILTECKKSSFGTKSSTAEQARTLMIINDGSFNDIMGIDSNVNAESSLVFFIPDDQKMLLLSTLKELESELNTNGIPPGGVYVVGVCGNDHGISIELNNELKKILRINDQSPILILDNDEQNDPRPLYFIPYDPSIDQNPEERNLCQQILYQRLLTALLSKIGRFIVPGEITVTFDMLLNDATFNMYSIWRNKATTSHLRSILRGFMAEIKTALPNNITKKFSFIQGRGWVFELSDQSDQDAFINVLSRIRITGAQISSQEQSSFNDLADESF